MYLTLNKLSYLYLISYCTCSKLMQFSTLPGPCSWPNSVASILFEQQGCGSPDVIIIRVSAFATPSEGELLSAFSASFASPLLMLFIFRSSDVFSSPCTTLRSSLYYIHTEKYSKKSCVVNFDTHMSSSQSEE